MTNIEWTQRPGTTGETWNPIRARRRTTGKVGWACVKVSPGCTHCYAERQNQAAARGGTGLPYTVGALDDVEAFLDERTLAQPLHWAAPRTVFVCSMTDLFGEWVPEDWVDRIFAVMALTPQHTFQVLTKRPERMRAYLADVNAKMGLIEGRAKRLLREQSGDPMKPVLVGKTLVGTWPWPSVWLGVSAEDQSRADERIPILLDTPAAVRFVSMEPLLEVVDWPAACGCRGFHRENCIDWVICGGESGPGARPLDVSWARSIRGQCASARIAFFMKQVGAHPCFRLDDEERHGNPAPTFDHAHGDLFCKRLSDRKGGDPAEWPEDLRVREWPR